MSNDAAATPAMAVDVAIVGAGPCGLAAAIAVQRAGLSVVLFDRGSIVHGIASYPTYMTFFSTAERIAIGGVPFIVATEKPTRRDALAYYRGVADLYQLDVRQFETVESICAESSRRRIGVLPGGCCGRSSAPARCARRRRMRW